MDALLDNFKIDLLQNLFQYITIAFFGIIILWFVIGVIEAKYNTSEKLTNVVTIIVIISTIAIMVLYMATSTYDKPTSLNEVKNIYNIEQHDDDLNFTKKHEVKNFIYKDKVSYKIKKEKVTTNFNYTEEHYILTDTNNNKKVKLNKEQLKKLISHTKTQQEKFNIEDLK